MNRYRVEKIDNKMIVILDRKGNYRALTAEEIEKAFSDPRFRTVTAEVRIGKCWYPLGQRAYTKKRTNRRTRSYSIPTPIKLLPLYLRILKRLHLYKDPLEKLIYHP